MVLGERIGQRITELMDAQGLSNAQLAKRLQTLREGSTAEGFRSQLINWKKGRLPDRENAALLAQALGVEASEFLPAQATQAELDRLRLDQERHEAEIQRKDEETNRKLADRSASLRQPQELSKPGSRTQRNG